MFALALLKNNTLQADVTENDSIENFNPKPEIVYTNAPHDASGLFSTGSIQTPSTQLTKKPSAFPIGGSKPTQPVVTPKLNQRIPPRTSQQNQQGNYGGFTKNDNGPGKPDKGSSTTYQSDEKVKLDKKKYQNSDYESYRYSKQPKQPQCSVDPVQESFRDSKEQRKLSERALDNQKVNREYLRILGKLENGTHPRDIGRRTTKVGKHIYYIRGSHGRYVVRQIGDTGGVEILGVGCRSNTKDMRKFAKLMTKLYDTHINPNAY